VLVWATRPGRRSAWGVAYLGLLPLAQNGVCDITDMYVAKYGPLTSRTKIFIVTRQQKNGWEGPLVSPGAPVCKRLFPSERLTPVLSYVVRGGTDYVGQAARTE
jgi:hypothetical protein